MEGVAPAESAGVKRVRNWQIRAIANALPLEFQQSAEALRLDAADRDFGVFAVVHA